LLLVARKELSPELLKKAGASDLVQESFLEAQRGFEGFRGKSEAELRAWLRRILLNNIANLSRLFRDTDKRQLDREVAGEDTAIEGLVDILSDRCESPSSQVAAHERDEALERSMAQLPELYRQVIRWRNYERCTFEEIGGRLGRSAEAARKLWARAVEQLQQLLDSPDAP
jgi:RNA polymerase sigma-70 factor (ECF subfamily)